MVENNSEILSVNNDEEKALLNTFFKNNYCTGGGEGLSGWFSTYPAIVYTGEAWTDWCWDGREESKGDEISVREFLEKYDESYKVVTKEAPTNSSGEWTDKHYNMNYTLTPEEIKQGFVKLDVYKVSNVWKTGSRDDSGALWHCLKTIARFGDKNSREREIIALHNQIKGLARESGVELD